MKTQLTNCVIHNSASADLDYAQWKLARAPQLLNKHKEATAQLKMAQGVGIRTASHERDSALVDVEHALRLTERMRRENQCAGAKAKLQTTSLQRAADSTLREGHESGNGYESTTA